MKIKISKFPRKLKFLFFRRFFEIFKILNFYQFHFFISLRVFKISVGKILNFKISEFLNFHPNFYIFHGESLYKILAKFSNFKISKFLCEN